MDSAKSREARRSRFCWAREFLCEMLFEPELLVLGGLFLWWFLGNPQSDESFVTLLRRLTGG